MNQIRFQDFLLEHQLDEGKIKHMEIYDIMFKLKLNFKSATQLKQLIFSPPKLFSSNNALSQQVFVQNLKSVISTSNYSILSTIIDLYFQTNKKAEILLIQTVQSTIQYIQRHKQHLQRINILKTDQEGIVKFREQIVAKVEEGHINLIIIDNIFNLLDNQDQELLQILNDVAVTSICFNSISNQPITSGSYLAIPQTSQSETFSPFVDLPDQPFQPCYRSQNYGIRSGGTLVCGSFPGKLNSIFDTQVVVFKNVVYVFGKSFISWNMQE